jgi:hemerythrin superfamily protein
MAKSSAQPAGNKQGRTNKDRSKDGGEAANTQPVQSRPETTMASAMAGAGLPQQAMTDPATQSAIAALRQDHRRVEGLFSEFESATEEQRKQELVEKICSELNIHTRLEEEIFYPACRDAIDDEDLMDEAQVEHDAAKLLIADLSEASSNDAYYDAKVKLLSEMIKHHVAEEEKPGQGVFAKAQAHNVDKPELATELAERKQELQRRAARLRPTRAVSLNLDISNLTEDSMARYSDMDRDDRGRFTSGRGGPRSRYEDDDRDERGRFASGRGGSRSRYDDDDDDRGSRGRGRGGWFGDSEGHSRAARDRWEDDDDYRGGRGRSSSRYDDDDDRGGRGRGGWFGDSEGHSRAARERFEDDDDRGGRGRLRSRYEDDDDDRGGRGRGRGGWFGDSEGHSRAARDRFEDDDDRGRGRSRSRYEDDDDDRGGRSHGRGGWFGDSEGHSRAARSRRDDDDDDDRRARGGSRSRSRDDDEGRGWFGDSRGHAEAARRGWAHRR